MEDSGMAEEPGKENRGAQGNEQKGVEPEQLALSG